MRLFDLTGRVAIVTGGNGGIGLGMALGLGEAGATVVVVGRKAEKNADAVASLTALGAQGCAMELDVGAEADCAAMVGRRWRGSVGSTSWSTMPGSMSASQPRTTPSRNGARSSTSTSPALSSAPRRPTRDGGRGRRQDHQYRLAGFDPRRPVRRPLCREQGRHRPAHPGARDRLGQGQHPGQRHPPGLDRDRPHQAGPHRRPRPARARPVARAGTTLGRDPAISPASPSIWPARRRTT